MTSIQGTDTAYGAIDGNYLALAPECSDTIFGTDINYCSLVKAGTSKNGFMKGYFKDGDEEDPDVIKQYQTMVEQFNKNITKGITLKQKSPSTINDLLHLIPEVSEISKIVDLTNYSKNLSFDMGPYTTFIAPSNDALKKAKNTWLKTTNPNVLRNLLMSHTLDFLLSPVTLQTRLTRVYTHNPAFWFVADGTGKFSNQLNFYQEPYTLQDLTYNLPYDRFNVLKTYTTDNGILYIIDGIFSPDIILYSTF